jgi:hypothetical protein
MAVELQEILTAEQAAGMRRQADASTNFMAAMDRKFLQVYTETDPVQSAAIKELARGRAPHPTEAAQ